MALPVRTEYYSGQGRVTYAERDSLGRPTGGFIFLGDCSKLETKATVEAKKHMEHQTGKNAVDARFETAQDVEIQATFDEIKKENLNLYLYGNSQELVTATVTAEAIVAALGKEVPLSRMPQSFTSLTDVGATTTYVEGTDYSVGLTGMLAFPTTSAIADGEDLEANYEARAERLTTAFTALNEDIYLRFDGLNRGSDNKPVVIEMYKARFNPAEMLAMINDDFATYDINGQALYDVCNADDSLYGGFMRVRVAQ